MQRPAKGSVNTKSAPCRFQNCATSSKFPLRFAHMDAALSILDGICLG